MPRKIEALERSLAEALAGLLEAEQVLLASENEFEELEAMISEVKARGEDNFDLAVERFQPVFFRFQDAAAAHAQTEAKVADARRALEAAMTRRAPH